MCPGWQSQKAARLEKRKAWAGSATCAREGCERIFEKRRPWQKWCTPTCRALAFEATQARRAAP